MSPLPHHAAASAYPGRTLVAVPLALGVLDAGGLATGSLVWADAGAEAFELDDLLHPPLWHAAAACRSRPDLTWFPARGDPVDEIRSVCQSCPVQEACLEWALAQGPTLAGWWGGVNDRSRKRMRRG